MSDSKETLSGPEYDRDPVPGWIYLHGTLATRLRTGAFDVGLRLVNEIGALAEDQDHHPDLDLRYGHLDVTVSSHDAGGVTSRDLRLARSIVAAAAAAEVDLTPTVRQRAEWGLDTDNASALAPFWTAVYGLPLDDLDHDAVVDPEGQLPVIWFQDAAGDSAQRFHLDIDLDPSEVPARIAAAVEAGGRLVSDEFAPSWWVLADPAGNHVCLCTWQGRNADQSHVNGG